MKTPDLPLTKCRERKMEDDIDIYEDLPDFSQKEVNNFHEDEENSCECAALREQIRELTAKLGDLQKLNETLEVNLSSLLKTAKAEIARKDRVIGELRKQLDDIAFRRTNHARPKPETKSIQNATQNHPDSKDENSAKFCAPETDSVHLELESYCANKTSSTKIKQNPSTVTVFSERLHKRIIEEENTERKRKQAEKLVENPKEQKENIPDDKESDKENGLETNTDKRETDSKIPRTEDNVILCEKTRDFHCDNLNIEDSIDNAVQNKIPKYSSKRCNRDSEVPSAKRLKVDNKEYSIKDHYSNEKHTRTHYISRDHEYSLTEDRKHMRHSDVKSERARSRDGDNYYKRNSRKSEERSVDRLDRRSSDRSSRSKGWNDERRSHGRSIDPRQKERRYPDYQNDKYRDRVKGTWDKRDYKYRDRDSRDRDSRDRQSRDVYEKGKSRKPEERNEKKYAHSRSSRDRNSVSRRSRSNSNEKINFKSTDKSDRDSKPRVEVTGTTKEPETANNQENNSERSETESLHCLEDGEILDSPNISPEKNLPNKTDKLVKLTNESTHVNTSKCTNENTSKCADEEDKEKSSCKDSLNSSASLKEERIENIEQFIKNYPMSQHVNTEDGRSKDTNLIDGKVPEEKNASVQNEEKSLDKPEALNSSQKNSKDSKEIVNDSSECVSTLPQETEKQIISEITTMNDSESEIVAVLTDDSIPDLQRRNHSMKTSNETSLEKETNLDRTHSQQDNHRNDDKNPKKLQNSKFVHKDDCEIQQTAHKAEHDSEATLDVASQRTAGTNLVNERPNSSDVQTKSSAKSVANKSDPAETDHCKLVVRARRRKPIQLADNNASMTLIISSSSAKCNVSTSVESTLKPRACKRACKTIC